MFTGIISHIGEIKSISHPDDWEISIDIKNNDNSKFCIQDERLLIGASISCSGICLTLKKSGGRIILVNIKINHLGGRSHGYEEDFEMEKSRNWHWMWSRFYFSKKHYGFIWAFIKTFPSFLNSFIKYSFYLMTFNNKKVEIIPHTYSQSE